MRTISSITEKNGSNLFKIQDSLFCTIYISLTTAKIKIKGENKEDRVLHIVEKEGEVHSDHSSKCF